MKRILFVDDEPRILMALRRSLRGFRNEWEMVFTEGGAAALEHCQAAPFDVVVSDARMPGMDGSELLAEVMRLYPDTVRITLSGQCSRNSVLKCTAVAHQFLSKPCEPGILKSAIQRVCEMRASFRDESARRALSRVQRLPSQVCVYSQLAEKIQSPEASLEQMAEIISRDVAMSAKVVQLVSSGFFGSPQRVRNAAEATILLGQETLRELWASSAAFQVRSEEHREEELQLLADHSRAVAESAREIMKTLTTDPVSIGDAHLAGLLHEVGTLALGENGRLRPPESDPTRSRPNSTGSTSIEGRAAGACPDPGGYLAALWGLPDPVVQAIAYHRIPDRCPKEAVAPLLAVHVAHALLDQSPGEQDGAAGPLDVDYLQKAGCRDRLQSWREICEVHRAGGVLS